MHTRNPFPKALEPPTEKVVLIDEVMILKAVEASRISPRKRIILPLHKSSSAKLHRMLNAIQPMSYIQPHRHADPTKVESFLVLQGAVWFYIFGDTGEVTDFYQLSTGSSPIGIDIEPGTYHCFAATVADTVLFEVKPGPYQESSDKDFAPWAPAEGDDEADGYLKKLYAFGHKSLHAGQG